jgi:GNAT superfamily N-acetyltransferase
LEIDHHNFGKLTDENVQSVYQLFENNSPFFSIPIDYFRRGTLEDKGFDSELSLILFESKKLEPIAAFIVVIRPKINENYCFFKGCVVDKEYQRLGIGSRMFKEFLKRAKEKGVTRIVYGPSVPDYWQPGVDIRNTDLYFFLKKHGFKTQKAIFNLTVSLNFMKSKPASKKGNYTYERVQPHDFKETFNFVKLHFPEGTWPEEVKSSFERKPPTTFVAKDTKNEIIGWATHSQFFPGSFGPTGVLKSLRGKGIGTELFLWTLWDLKQNGLDNCEIMWVVGETVKFYSKTVGAYISPIYFPMYKKIK